MAAHLVNVYYERKAGTPRACYICRMPTPVVLATLNAEDFIYVCEKHLTDPGFASPIAPPPAPSTPTPSADDIASAISSYQAKQAKKSEKDKDKDADSKEKDKDKDAKEKKAPPPPAPLGLPSPAASASPAPGSPGGAAAAAVKAGHRKFELHRGIFAMRQREIKGRDQAVKAREAAKGLPQVPRGTFGGP